MVVSFSTDDVEQARAFASATFVDIARLEPTCHSDDFQLSISAVEVGPMAAGVLRFGCETTASITGPTSGYCFGIHLGGRLKARVGAHDVIADHTTAFATGPTVDVTASGWSDPSERSLLIVFDQLAVEAEMARLAGRDVMGPVALAPEVDLRDPRSTNLLGLVRPILHGLESPSDHGLHPLFLAPLSNALITSFLLATDHRFSARLQTPRTPLPASTFRDAVDFMHEHAAEPITVADVAAHVGATLRSLRFAFLAETAASPYEVLWRIRMDRTHHELTAGEPGMTSVDEVAHRWGFTDIKRYAAAYTRTFGVAPSHTLGHESTRTRPPALVRLTVV